MSRWLDRRRDSRVDRWMDSRRPWQFAVICWAGVMAGPLLGTAIVAAWHGSLGQLIEGFLSLIGVFIGSIVVGVIAFVSRQRRKMRTLWRSG